MSRVRRAPVQPPPAVPLVTKGSVGKIPMRTFYRLVISQQAARVKGPFTCRTRDADVLCQDGWVAVDQGGWPYPIAADEFPRILTDSVNGLLEQIPDEVIAAEYARRGIAQHAPGLEASAFINLNDGLADDDRMRGGF